MTTPQAPLSRASYPCLFVFQVLAVFLVLRPVELLSASPALLQVQAWCTGLSLSLDLGSETRGHFFRSLLSIAAQSILVGGAVGEDWGQRPLKVGVQAACVHRPRPCLLPQGAFDQLCSQTEASSPPHPSTGGEAPHPDASMKHFLSLLPSFTVGCPVCFV